MMNIMNSLVTLIVIVSIIYFGMFMQVNGLKTKLLICDGASSNLTTIKATHGHTGMYGMSATGDPYAVQPWFINPYDPPNRIYWLICPSHQVQCRYFSEDQGLIEIYI